MTWSQAVNIVENALTALKLKDRFGDDLIGIIAAGSVARFHGKHWDELEDKVYSELIAPHDYVEQAVLMIQAYTRDLQLKRERDLTRAPSVACPRIHSHADQDTLPELITQRKDSERA